MKQFGLLTAIFFLALANAQAATRSIGLSCDNDGRCIQRAAPATRLQRSAHAGQKIKAASRRRASVDANGNPAGLIKAPTAAGIVITVAPGFAPRITGFIADLTARGYRPHRISCYSWAPSHVANSLHHSGEACDFDQRGWGRTPAAMHHVRGLAARWGLRDGCSFGDCGHIDSGRRLAGARRPWPRLAAARPSSWCSAPCFWHRSFEEGL